MPVILSLGPFYAITTSLSVSCCLRFFNTNGCFVLKTHRGATPVATCCVACRTVVRQPEKRGAFSAELCSGDFLYNNFLSELNLAHVCVSLTMYGQI